MGVTLAFKSVTIGCCGLSLSMWTFLSVPSGVWISCCEADTSVTAAEKDIKRRLFRLSKSPVLMAFFKIGSSLSLITQGIKSSPCSS